VTTKQLPAYPATSPTTREENAMATTAISTAHLSAPEAGSTVSSTHREWAKRALRRRAGRICGLLLVLALLLPLLITALFGGH
jgi:hypothetical protein